MNINKTLKIIEEYLSQASFEHRIEMINTIKSTLSNYSPFQHHPVDCIHWVKMNSIKVNNYNPNVMSPEKKNLLRLSLLQNGFTQPLIVHDEKDNYIVIDGAFRFTIGMETPELQQKHHGYFPIVKLNKENSSLPKRMAATIRHNRTQGKHSIEGMINIVITLSDRGWSVNKIAHELGMEHDEVLRLKQISGLTTLYEEAEFSEAWTII